MDEKTLLGFMIEQCEEHLADIEDTESDMHPETGWVYMSHAVIRTAVIFADHERGIIEVDGDYQVKPSSNLGILGRLDDNGVLFLNPENLLGVNNDILYQEDNKNESLLKLAKKIVEGVLQDINGTQTVAPLMNAIRGAICETWASYFEQPPVNSFLNEIGESRGEILQFFWMWTIALIHDIE